MRALTIYGMTLSIMNQLSTLGMIFQQVPKNTITIAAGGSESAMAVVFSGTVITGWIDFSGAPEVSFKVEAATGLDQAVATAPPTSYNGSVQVATIRSGLATLAGLGFENNGVTGVLAYPYLYGSPRNQMAADAEHAGFEWTIDCASSPGSGLGVLAIWPRGGPVPTFSPKSSLVGYPTSSAHGIVLKVLFDPRVGLGRQIKIEGGQLPAANKTWNVYGRDLDLDALVPNGQWFVHPGVRSSVPAPAHERAAGLRHVRRRRRRANHRRDGGHSRTPKEKPAPRPSPAPRSGMSRTCPRAADSSAFFRAVAA